METLKEVTKGMITYQGGTITYKEKDEGTVEVYYEGEGDIHIEFEIVWNDTSFEYDYNPITMSNGEKEHTDELMDLLWDIKDIVIDMFGREGVDIQVDRTVESTRK